MSDENRLDDQGFEKEFGRELRASMHRLERAGSSPDDVRARAGARMHAARAARIAEQEGRSSPNLDQDRPNHELMVAILDAEHDDGLRTARWSWLAAAAAVIVLIAALSLVTRRAPDEVPADQPPTSEAAVVPRELGVGRFSTDVLGPSLTFGSEESLWLLESDSRVVRFGLGPPGSDRSTMTIARPTGVATGLAVDGLDELFGSIPGAQRTPSVVDGNRGTKWRIPNPGSSDLCDAGVCESLFDSPESVSLPAEGTADVFRLDVDGLGEVVILVEIEADDFVLDDGGRFADVIDSIEFGPLTPTVAPPSIPTVVQLEE